MKAIGTIDSSKNFIDFEIEKPILRPHDLLIKSRGNLNQSS